jgi:hypothetical protein
MHNNELIELTLQASRMVTGDVWAKLTSLDLTDHLNDQEKWVEATTPELREIVFHQLVVILTEQILLKWRIQPTDNALRLCSMFIIQVLLNQSKPELKMEMLGWLEKSKVFFNANNSTEAKEALLAKLENRR